jgi:hypothetical protein
MDTHNSLYSPAFMLNEQIARQIFEIIPENGPVILIIDRNGNNWPSDSEEFSKLNISEPFLKELCMKIDDGVEPVTTQTNNCSIIAAQLATDKSNCGYVIMALPQCDEESTLKNIHLIEMLLNQFSLIAKLIEKNNHLYEFQIRNYSGYSNNSSILN